MSGRQALRLWKILQIRYLSIIKTMYGRCAVHNLDLRALSFENGWNTQSSKLKALSFENG